MSSSTTDTSIQAILERITTSGRAYLDGQATVRSELISQTRALLNALERPNETLTWLAWAEPTRRAAIEVALQLGLFRILSSPKSAGEVASECKAASPVFVQRVLRHLAATAIITELGPSTYAPTPVSRALANPVSAAALRYSQALPGPVLARLPSYLAHTDYRNPDNLLDGPFQYAMQTQETPWNWARSQPGLSEIFALHMSGYHAERPSWMDPGFYPVEDRLVRGCKPGQEDVFLVDVGGGVGHDLEELKNKCPTVSKNGRLVLQETPSMIAQAKRMRPWLQSEVHDFFQPQPIQGARAYYMHSVLHDWQDEQCREILRHLRDAMERDYSKILINENVIPDAGAAWQITSLDWTMMATVASAERTETQWRRLIESVGLRVAGIWVKDPACESLIEVTRDEVPKL
ncbi:MAG: hypothetical protein Q9219_000616 [cf. Caloplaca sp. 3 TL-2023]